MQLSIRTFISFLFISLTSFSFAKDVNNLHFSQISTKDGLSQNTVRAILVDQTGFIWAGTLDGLNRFDGYNIITYEPEIGNHNSLVDHRVKNIFQDSNGYLWIKTYNNEFSCYNPTHDIFTPYLNAGDNNTKYSYFYEASNGDIWLWGDSEECVRIQISQQGTFTSTSFLKGVIGDYNFLYEDDKTNIWIGGEFGLYCIKDDKVQLIPNSTKTFTGVVEIKNQLFFSTQNALLIAYDKQQDSFSEIPFSNTWETFTSLTKFNDSELIIATKNSGILSYDIPSETFQKPDWANDKQLVGEINFINDKTGGVWIYNNTGIVWHYNSRNHAVRKMELIPPSVAQVIDYERYVILTDSTGLIWITTYGNGLFSYNPQNEELCNYKYIDNQNSPASDYLLSITEDSHGNIWIGSEYAGILKVVKSDYNVNVIKPESDTSVGKNNNIRSLFIDEQRNCWVGTKSGNLYVYDEDFKDIKSINKNINSYALTTGNDGEIWVGTKGNGLYIFNPKDFSIEQHLTQKTVTNGLSHNSIFSILKDSKNRMWIGTFGGGINMIEQDGKIWKTKHFFTHCGNQSYIRHLLQDHEGNIWAATSEGILLFNPEQLIENPKDFRSFKMDIDTDGSINCNDIKTIFEDSKHNIWVGTAGGGISQYIPKTENHEAYFKPFTIAEGLVGDFVSGILEDDANRLWISTERGISKFNPRKFTASNYQFSEKTFGNHFNENTNVIDSLGNMIWGSLDGLLIFNPASFSSNINVTPVTLTSFSIHGQSIQAKDIDSPLQESISSTKKITLNYTQNTFSIAFSALNLKDPSKNRYTYILENYDTDWSVPSTSNVATYKNLPHGKYIFKVHETNSNNTSHEAYTELYLTIMPPFWLSIYAYIFYILLLGAILYVILQLTRKFNILNNNIRVEKQLTEHKLRFFTNISHEFRTPLTLIRGAVENLNELEDCSDQVKKQVNVLGKNSNSLSRLIDQLLEFRKLENEAATLDLEEVDMVNFSKDIYANFQELAKQKNIDYQFICGNDNYNMFIDQNKVDKMLYNLLSNAFKFTQKNGCIEFSLQFNFSAETCHIKVKDNGVGIPKEKQDLLFSRFMQINFSTTGTGVGLSLVKDFVDIHQGKIWYENNQQQGSIFHIELPTNVEVYPNANFIGSTKEDVILNDNFSRIIHPSYKVENEDVKTLPSIDKNKKQVLIIDDNEDIRNFLNDEFNKHFNITLAENGKEGLETAIELNPDLIICDVMMPEMDGFELTRQLKNNFNTCHIPVILLTAHSSIEHQLEGIQCGADTYIMKPFSLKYLVTRAFKLLEQREQLKKKFSNDFVLDGELITSSEKDKIFINSLDKILEEHVIDSQFSVDRFAQLANMKRTVFYNKIKSITDLSPNDLIKQKRMKIAGNLLLGGNDTVSEIAYKVGFEDPLYFSKCFKAQYNCSPSKYRKGKDETI